jgi:hypothetical protein
MPSTVFSYRSNFDRRQNALARALVGRADRLDDLTRANPTRAELPYPTDAIARSVAAAARTPYAPDPFGDEDARRVVAEREGVDPAQVMLTASTSEAYSFLFKLLADADDEVLVPEPSYPLLSMLARLEGIRLVPYPIHYDGEWHITAGTVQAATTPRTRAVVAINPNNPTGSFLKRDELRALYSVGRPLIVDEVFADYPFGEDPRRARSIPHGGEGLTFTLSGLSKVAGMPQLKLAWLVVSGPRPQRDEALSRLELIGDTYLSPSGPAQGACGALLAAGEELRGAIRERTRRNLESLTARLAGRSAATLVRPEGGWYAVLQLPSTRSEERWVLDFVRRGVLVQPGWFYDFATEPFVVLSLLTPPRIFDRGLSSLLAEVDGA